MIGEDAEPPAGGTAILYDWFKHLTSLSLLTIGGVLGLSQIAGGEGIKKALLVTVLLFVLITGVLSFSAAGEVVKSRSAGVPLPGYIHRIRTTASVAPSVGVGAFTYVFLGSL